MHESKGSEMETTRPLRGAGRSKGKGVRRMELTIKGEAKEIAALVLELQGRRKQEIKLVVDGSKLSDAVKRGLDLPDLTAP